MPPASPRPRAASRSPPLSSPMLPRSSRTLLCAGWAPAWAAAGPSARPRSPRRPCPCRRPSMRARTCPCACAHVDACSLASPTGHAALRRTHGPTAGRTISATLPRGTASPPSTITVAALPSCYLRRPSHVHACVAVALTPPAHGAGASVGTAAAVASRGAAPTSRRPARPTCMRERRDAARCLLRGCFREVVVGRDEPRKARAQIRWESTHPVTHDQALIIDGSAASRAGDGLLAAAWAAADGRPLRAATAQALRTHMHSARRSAATAARGPTALGMECKFRSASLRPDLTGATPTERRIGRMSAAREGGAHNAERNALALHEGWRRGWVDDVVLGLDKRRSE
eukprot:160165-Chlamydomonas_euryale.AAC.2